MGRFAEPHVKEEAIKRIEKGELRKEVAISVGYSIKTISKWYSDYKKNTNKVILNENIEVLEQNRFLKNENTKLKEEIATLIDENERLKEVCKLLIK